MVASAAPRLMAAWRAGCDLGPEAPGSVCRWVHDRTSNETLASITDWIIGVPLRVALILVVAWLIRRVARLLIRRFVRRIAGDGVVVPPPGWAGGSGAPGPGPAGGDPRQIARATSIGGVLSSTVSVIVWTVALILALSELGINVAPLIAGAGVAGVALGFGTQSLVRDCVTGLFMIIEDQYGLGDIVDFGPATGVVESVSLRTTVVRGEDGTVWHVPHGEVRRVGNRSQLWSVAIVDVLVPADQPLDRAKAAVMEAAREVCARPELAATVLEAPRMLGVEAISADAVTLRVTTRTTPGAQYALQRAMQETVKHRLDDDAAAAATSPPAPGDEAGASP